MIELKYDHLRGHKLLTKKILASMPRIGATEGLPKEVKLVQVKYFTPFSCWTWYAVEGEWVRDKEGREVDYRFFGFVDGDFPEWGYFCLSEFDFLTLGIPAVERDRFFDKQAIAPFLKGVYSA